MALLWTKFKSVQAVSTDTVGAGDEGGHSVSVTPDVTTSFTNVEMDYLVNGSDSVQFWMNIAILAGNEEEITEAVAADVLGSATWWSRYGHLVKVMEEHWVPMNLSVGNGAGYYCSESGTIRSPVNIKLNSNEKLTFMFKVFNRNAAQKDFTWNAVIKYDSSVG